MKFLREEYTKEEIEDRIVDARNAIVALTDALYVLQTALEEAEKSTSQTDLLARYVRGYIDDVSDLSQEFYDDFETFLEDEEEEFDIDEVDFEDEEI